MQQSNVTRKKAIKALKNNDNDIVNAIMVSYHIRNIAWICISRDVTRFIKQLRSRRYWVFVFPHSCFIISKPDFTRYFFKSFNFSFFDIWSISACMNCHFCNITCNRLIKFHEWKIIPPFFLKGTLMQIWGSANIFVFIWKSCCRFHIKTLFTFWDMGTWEMWKVCFQTFRKIEYVKN